MRWTGVCEEAGAYSPFLLFGQGSVNGHTADLVTPKLMLQGIFFTTEKQTDDRLVCVHSNAFFFRQLEANILK